MTPDAEFFPSARYEDAPAAIDWLCAKFGFERLLVVPGDDGSIAHAELALDGSVYMLGSLRATNSACSAPRGPAASPSPSTSACPTLRSTTAVQSPPAPTSPGR